MKHVGKVWKAGTKTIVITIPKVEKELKNIEQGDYIHFELNEIIKKVNQTEFIKEN
jgi:hypothetical protein